MNTDLQMLIYIALRNKHFDLCCLVPSVSPYIHCVVILFVQKMSFLTFVHQQL